MMVHQLEQPLARCAQLSRGSNKSKMQKLQQKELEIPGPRVRARLVDCFPVAEMERRPHCVVL